MTTELKEGDLAIFVRDNTCAGPFYGEEGDVVVLGPSQNRHNTSFAISGLPELCRSLRRNRSWFDQPNQVIAYTKDLKKLETVDVGDLEDDF